MPTAVNCLVSVFSGFDKICNSKKNNVQHQGQSRACWALAFGACSFTAAGALLSAIPPGDPSSHPRASADTRNLPCRLMPFGRSSVRLCFTEGQETRESRGPWRCDEPGLPEGARGSSCYFQVRRSRDLGGANRSAWFWWSPASRSSPRPLGSEAGPRTRPRALRRGRSVRRYRRQLWQSPPPHSPAWKDTAGSFLSGPGRLKVDCAPTSPVSLATLGFRSHRLPFFSCQHQKFLSTKIPMCIFIKKKQQNKSCASCAREATS